ncbi:MAG: hypothetical protein RL088_4019 [Verrucomicrobiota bacterium]|jgi:hypothetical protein
MNKHRLRKLVSKAVAIHRGIAEMKQLNGLESVFVGEARLYL